MSTPVLFVARKYVEAAYWAQAWGFTRDQWQHVGPVRRYVPPRGNHGIAFVCGSEPRPGGAILHLRTQGYDTFVDAHDLDTCREPRSALDGVW